MREAGREGEGRSEGQWVREVVNRICVYYRVMRSHRERGGGRMREGERKKNRLRWTEGRQGERQRQER